MLSKSKEANNLPIFNSFELFIESKTCKIIKLITKITDVIWVFLLTKVFLRKLSNRCFKDADNIHPSFQLITGTKTAEVCLADIWNASVLCWHMLPLSENSWIQTKPSPCF